VSRYHPVSRQRLADELAAELSARHRQRHPLRVGLDAPACADLAPVLTLLAERLREAGHPVEIHSGVYALQDDFNLALSLWPERR